MSTARDKWDLRHRESASHPSPDPSAFLLECSPLLPRPHSYSRALDLACGAGQNAVYLAEHGWPVIAIDFSPPALDRAAALAAEHHLPTHRSTFQAVPAHFSGVLLVEADLESLAFPAAAFDLILCFHYLDRNLFAPIERALRPGGHLLYESFTELQLAYPEGPRDPNHLLRTGELRSAFPHLDVLFYRECQSPRAVASLLAQRPH
jgi:SAM-dependent methyltransferase